MYLIRWRVLFNSSALPKLYLVKCKLSTSEMRYLLIFTTARVGVKGVHAVPSVAYVLD